MKISQKYSHLNGEEFLLVHHNELYEEIKSIIEKINCDEHKTKISQEKRKTGKALFNPSSLNKALEIEFSALNWEESRYDYYITLNRELMERSIMMPSKEQKIFLESKGEKNPIYSYNQTDFIKEGIAVEIQFGKYAFVAYDLFVKHMMFYSAGKINLGIEILPTKKMQSQMSSGPAFFEGEVYNVMRNGRNNPPVPLLILGIE